MFKIGRFPSKLEPFFRSLKTCFHWNHFEYFRTFVLLIAFAWGRRNVSALYRHLDSRGKPHRTRFNNFFLVGRWDPEELLRKKAYELLARLKPRKGDIIYLIIDDSKKQKRGKDMEGVSIFYDSSTDSYFLAHKFVKATLKFRGHVIPFAIRLYVKKEECPQLELEFKKLTQLAAQIIREFAPPRGVKVRVLFDSYYMCHTVVKACRKKGFRFVSVLKSNRNLFKRGRKLKVGKYGRNLFRRKEKEKKNFVIHKESGKVNYTYVDVGWLDVSNLGKLHVLFSRKGRDKKILGIVTDDPELSGADMIRTYNERWSIEVFFKDAKQLLGLGQYQNGSYIAAVTHLHLVCFAYALLTHIAIEREGAQGKRKSKKAAKLSTGRLQNELRRIVWEELADYLKELPSGDQVVKELERLLIAS
jgi:SRSO17 transposase